MWTNPLQCHLMGFPSRAIKAPVCLESVFNYSDRPIILRLYRWPNSSGTVQRQSRNHNESLLHWVWSFIFIYLLFYFSWLLQWICLTACLGVILQQREVFYRGVSPPSCREERRRMWQDGILAQTRHAESWWQTLISDLSGNLGHKSPGKLSWKYCRN